MAKGSGLSPSIIDTIEPQKAKVVIADLLQLHNLGKPKNDDEVEERLEQYFELCRNSSLRPGIESMAAALCIDRTTLWRWSEHQGCSQRCTEAIRNAKLMIHSFIEQSMLQGLINPVVGIFLSKNWMGYRDVSSHETLSPVHSDNLILSQEEIAKRIPVYEVSTQGNDDDEI